MKKLVKSISLVLALVLCFSAGVYAAGNTEVIQALMNYGIVIKFDGQTQNMYNANGKQVFPISYEGTTYVPIRAVSNMLGIDVEWDGPNNTVWLGKTGTAKNFIEMKPYAGVNGHVPASKGKKVSIGGKDYSEYIGFGGTMSGNTTKSYYNLEGKYETLKFDAYAPSSDWKLQLFGDNDELLETITVEGNDLPKTYTIDVSNVTQLTIQSSVYSYDRIGYIFNATIE